MKLTGVQLKESLQLYLVMGSQNCQEDPVVILEQAIQGGVTFFQFREKGKNAFTGEEKQALGLKLKNVCNRFSVPFIVNDDIDLALALDADGIHIGQEDGDIEQVRKRIGSDKILGVSTHNLKEAMAAEKAGVDYIGVGPMYHTSTKLDIEEVRGSIVIEEIRSQLPSIPIVGIGGITINNARTIIEAGANGVAVISAISNGAKPKETARAFINTIE